MLPAALYSAGDAGGIQGRFRFEPDPGRSARRAAACNLPAALTAARQALVQAGG
ncbi:hypothetical protein XHV734_1032 [Xanthomonas hortorum pv. vitians]|nr:hypothetical protein XHC_3540 [Xanthomonas hortorum pv. carotae str. M081]QNM59862.1 hypothetical protein XHV734_1032 [Xanthomonas hortorum pv. vitians]